MSAQIVFVHGWGMSPDFWDKLATQLPDIQTRRIDLGFTSPENERLESAPVESAIYITHSLGTLWALQNHGADMKGLIAINGFACFRNFVEDRVLRAMRARLKKHPEDQMHDFWDTYGLPHADVLNKERLAQGLEWLAEEDATPELQTLNSPVLAMAGQNDALLPPERMQEEWSGFDLKTCEGGGHALPYTHPHWCAQYIRTFIDAL